MANIKEVVLFYSKYSPKCRNVNTFIDYHKFPISRISIDSKTARSIIKNGNHFKIKGVPTLIVLYDDGDAALYEGDKVLSWLGQLLEGSHESPKSNDENMYSDNESDDEYEMLEDDVNQKKKYKNVKDQKMASVKDLAKQMEAERKLTLGYDEDKLPRP